MKTAFEIKHEEPAAPDAHVLLEIAHYGISFLWFKKDPLTIDAVVTYNFPEEQDSESFTETIHEIISQNKIDKKENAHVFYNFRESLLIPSEFMDEHTYADQLDLLYGIAPSAFAYYDEVTLESGIGMQDKMFCVYRVPADIRELAESISSNIARHSTGVQVRLNGNNVLQCTVAHNTVKIFLYGNSQLLSVQHYAYKTPADVVYHLLNVCDKHNINPGEISLHIDGMIDSESGLYQEIHKYFLNIHFNVIADDIFLSTGIAAHPLHFISHLTELARCV